MRRIFTIMLAAVFLITTSTAAGAASNDIGAWKYSSKKTGFGTSVFYATQTVSDGITYVFTVACLDTDEWSHSIMAIRASRSTINWRTNNSSAKAKIDNGSIGSMNLYPFSNNSALKFKMGAVAILQKLSNKSTITLKTNAMDGMTYTYTFKVNGAEKVLTALKAQGCS